MLHLTQRGGQVKTTCHRAPHEIVVAAQVFGQAVEDQVDPEVQRALVVRCRKGGVDHRQQLVAPRDRHQPFQIQTAHKGIGRGFGKNQTGLGADRCCERLVVAEGNQGAVDPVAAQKLLAEFERAGVALVGQQKMLARLQQKQQGGGHGRHPAADRDRVLGTFQFGDLGFEGAHGRVAIAPILLPFGGLPEEAILGVGDQVGRARKGIDGTLDNRNGQAVVRSKACFTSVDCLCRVGGRLGRPSQLVCRLFLHLSSSFVKKPLSQSTISPTVSGCSRAHGSQQSPAGVQ